MWLLLAAAAAAAGEEAFSSGGLALDCARVRQLAGGARVHLVAGKIAAGKSSFSRLLERCLDLEVLSADAFLKHLAPQLRVEEFALLGPQVKSLIVGLARRFLARGVRVGVDFSFWSREERDSVRRQLEPHASALWHVHVEEETRLRRLERRNARLPQDCFEVDREYAQESALLFEAPSTEDEGAILVES